MTLLPGKKKPGLPPYWNQYRRLNQLSFPKKTPLDVLTFSVIDIESTGLNLKKDKMIAFAGIRIQNLKIWVNKSLEFVINHEDHLQDGAIHIHEITRKEKRTGISENEAIEKIIQFIGDSILVGFHVQFDYRMINQALKHLIGKKLLNKIINIPDLIKRIEEPVHPIYPSFGLDLKKQCEAYGIEMTDQHTAAGDAFTAAQLFLKVLSKLDSRGIRNLGGLLKK